MILYYSKIYYYYYYYAGRVYTFAESLMRRLRRRRLRYPFCFNVDQLLTLTTNNDVCAQTL